MVWTFVGPAGASIHWDRYLRVSAENGTLARETLARRVSNVESASTAEQEREAMLHAMLRHLERVVAWDPEFARARLRLAAHLVSEFERRQQTAANAMDVSQIADAAVASQFKSSAELKSWLDRAFGEDSQLLYRALEHAHAGVAQSPLQGEGYLVLANLCFLEGATRAQVAAYVDQGLRVRPHDGELLFAVGKRALVDGDVDTAMRQWTKCFQDTGPHQLKIINLLAGRIPAKLFLENFQPDWHTLPQIWPRYRDAAQPQDLADLVAYAAMVTKRQVAKKGDIPPDAVWLWLATMYDEVHRPADALACLEEAYSCNPRSFEVRYALGRTLMEIGRYAEAEPHFRWCFSRRPQNRDLSVALNQISKQRHAERNPDDAARPNVPRAWNR
jgi:tetratricopeptide (TPR) repeat protein